MNFRHREETGEKQIILRNLLENILFVRWKNILNREHLLPRGCSHVFFSLNKTHLAHVYTLLLIKHNSRTRNFAVFHSKRHEPNQEDQPGESHSQGQNQGKRSRERTR